MMDSVDDGWRYFWFIWGIILVTLHRRFKKTDFHMGQSRLRVDHIMQGYYVRRQQNVDLFMDKREKKGMQKLPMPISLTSLLL